MVERQTSVARSLSQNLQERDNNETFFFWTLQLTVQEWIAQLKDGRCLLAIALSSNAGDAYDGDDKGATETKMDETLRGAQASLVTSQKNINQPVG